MQENSRSSYLMVILAMLIFSTVGIFRRAIPLSSAALACVRGILGSLFLYACILVQKRKLELHLSAGRMIMLIASGIALGLNWMLLFEAYSYTSVSIATLCYYMEPTIVILLSPLMFKEKLTCRKLLCTAVSMLGMVLVSGTSAISGSDFKGILFGLGAAALYATVVILNKKNPIADPYAKTIVQLLAAAAVMFPYVLLSGGFAFGGGMNAFMMTLVVGIVHTGIAYALYFGGVDKLRSQSAAVISYLDPIGALILSAVILHEAMTIPAMVGAVMIIGAALVQEFA